MTYNELVDKAMKARENSYSPYSGFRVGAALLTEDNSVYTGTNIENASYGLTICAERTAIFKAISGGCKKITALAVACDTEDFDSAFPCGACRQVMAEFMDGDADVIIADKNGTFKAFKLKVLLPYSFRLQTD